MVRWLLTILPFVLAAAPAPAARWLLLDSSGEVTFTADGDPSAQPESIPAVADITTGKDGRARLFSPKRGVVHVAPESRLIAKPTLLLKSGHIRVATAEGQTLPFEFDDLQPRATGGGTLWIERSEGRLRLCLAAGARLTDPSAELGAPRDTMVCYLSKDGAWTESEGGEAPPIWEESGALPEALRSPFPIDAAPDIESESQGESIGFMASESGSAEQSSAGESMCLEPGGTEGSASEIGSEQSAVEVGQPDKATVKVKIKLRE